MAPLLHFYCNLFGFYINIYDLCTLIEITYTYLYIMAEQLEVKELDQVVVRFSGDSVDGMQLAGNFFSTVSATVSLRSLTIPPTFAPRKAR